MYSRCRRFLVCFAGHWLWLCCRKHTRHRVSVFPLAVFFGTFICGVHVRPSMIQHLSKRTPGVGGEISRKKLGATKSAPTLTRDPWKLTLSPASVFWLDGACGHCWPLTLPWTCRFCFFVSGFRCIPHRSLVRGAGDVPEGRRPPLQEAR